MTWTENDRRIFSNNSNFVTTSNNNFWFTSNKTNRVRVLSFLRAVVTQNDHNLTCILRIKRLFHIKLPFKCYRKNQYFLVSAPYHMTTLTSYMSHVCDYHTKKYYLFSSFKQSPFAGYILEVYHFSTTKFQSLLLINYLSLISINMSYFLV